jgi:hypothetical protein
MSNGCIGPINIIPDNNEVILQDVNQVITVIDNNCCTTVDITQPTTAVVQILTGPMGQFPTEGSFGFTGSFDISGSLTVTGSISSNYIQSPYFTGSFYGNGTGIFSGSFSGSISSNLQEVTDNGATTTNVISASGLDTNALNVLGNVNVTGSLIVSGSNTFRNIGPAQFTGSTDITGSLSVNGVDYEFTSASFDTRILNNSSSISLLSGSFLNTSGSLSTRVTDLESFSSSLDATFATDAELNAATASLSGSISYLSSSYLDSSASFNTRILDNSSSIALLSGSFTNFSSSYSTGSFTGSFTGSLKGIAASASYASTASYVLNAVSSSFSSTASYLNTLNQDLTFNGNLILNGTASITYLDVTYESASVIYSSGSNQLGDATNDIQTLIGTVKISGSLQVTGSTNIPSITGSLLGTSSYAINAATASNILGGKATHIPFFITDTTLATSSIYQSGSTSIIINQDANTTANPEALYVWQPSTSSFNVISGKGNLNNYLQLNIQNTNQGVTASSDVVATANNGNEFTNYIDMGINNENFSGDIGGPNAGYLYSTGQHLHIGNASNFPIQFFAGGLDSDANRKLQLSPNNYHEMTGSLDVSGSIVVLDGITGSLQGTASYANNALTASYASNSDLLDGKDSSIFATTGSNVFIGNQIVTGSLFTTGSNTLIGSTTLTGSLSISGSTVQVGNNTLLGNTILSGSIVISSSLAPGNLSASVNIFGDTAVTGFIKFNPYSTNIDTSISASYVFVSGSTNDLYFSQNGNGYNNTTRLRWLEGNLYTGLLNGALITTASATTFNISSGSGVIVSLNASLNDNPYPTIQYVNWGNLTNQPLTYRTSSVQTFVGIDSNGQIIQQTNPWIDGQYNTSISVGTVIHQNLSTINASITYPNVAYGYKQRTYDFIKAFGPLKLSGCILAVSGSSTGSLIVGSGTAFADGRNYQVDPNNPSYITDQGTTVSKIFRYYESGSTFVQDTNGGLGYGAIDPLNYNLNGTLTPVPGTGANREWSIQRVFWYPNSATKGIVVYYGNATYLSEVDAAANLQYETFNETPNTQQNAIYLGAIAVRNNADFTDSDSYKILPAGVFRNIGGSGGGSTVTATLATLGDVTLSGLTNGQPLVYNTTSGKWQNLSTLTASLNGNASTATSASYALTASYVQNALSSSYALTASYVANASSFPYTGSAIITGSLIITGSTISTLGFTGSLEGTSSWAQNSISASYALSSSYSTTSISSSYATSASYLIGGVVSASYAATSSHATNFVVESTLALNGTLTDSATVNSSIVGSNNLFTQATGSRTSAFGKYTIFNGANARAGEFITVWNGTTTTYTDTSTTDIGSTADITFGSIIVGGNIEIDAVATSSGWKIKMLTTFI